MHEISYGIGKLLATGVLKSYEGCLQYIGYSVLVTNICEFLVKVYGPIGQSASVRVVQKKEA